MRTVDEWIRRQKPGWLCSECTLRGLMQHFRRFPQMLGRAERLRQMCPESTGTALALPQTHQLGGWVWRCCPSYHFCPCRLTNCQLATQGSDTFPCHRRQSLKECTEQLPERGYALFVEFLTHADRWEWTCVCVWVGDVDHSHVCLARRTGRETGEGLPV